MKNLKLAIACITLSTFVSCSDDDSTPEPIIEETPTTEIKFGYSENNLNNSSKLFIVNNTLDKVKYSNDHYEVFYYNTSNKIEKIEFYKPNNTILYTYEFFYNSNVLDHSVKQYTGYNSKAIETYSYNGNIIDITIETINLTTNEVINSTSKSLELDANSNILSYGYKTYQYDNKFNPYSNLSSLKELIIYYKDNNPTIVSYNNITTIDNSASTEDYTYTYVYDSSDRITEKKQFTAAGGTLNYIENIKYN